MPWAIVRFDRFQPGRGLPHKHFVEVRSRVAIQQEFHAPGGLGLRGTGVHRHEGLVALVLDEAYVAAALARLQQPSTDEALVPGVRFIRPGEPLAELGVLPGLDRRKMDDVHKHRRHLFLRHAAAWPSRRASHRSGRTRLSTLDHPRVPMRLTRNRTNATLISSAPPKATSMDRSEERR